MNNVVLIGRLTKDPDVRSTQDGKMVARYFLAVDRRGKDAGADFIGCVAFGKSAEFVRKYLAKGTKIALTGRIQTGSYQNKEGKTVYTTDVIVENHEFVESKGSAPAASSGDDFMSIPDDVQDDGLPFA